MSIHLCDRNVANYAIHKNFKQWLELEDYTQKQLQEFIELHSTWH